MPNRQSITNPNEGKRESFSAARPSQVMYWYMIRFTGGSPFSHSALYIKTLAMAALGTDYRDSTKRNMPKAWFEKLRHNHVAVDDPIDQGILFCNALAVIRAKMKS